MMRFENVTVFCPSSFRRSLSKLQSAGRCYIRPKLFDKKNDLINIKIVRMDKSETSPFAAMKKAIAILDETGKIDLANV